LPELEPVTNATFPSSRFAIVVLLKRPTDAATQAWVEEATNIYRCKQADISGPAPRPEPDEPRREQSRVLSLCDKIRDAAGRAHAVTPAFARSRSRPPRLTLPAPASPVAPESMMKMLPIDCRD
jgi:hypothetical protein